MTATVTETIEALDLSDLDLLDEMGKHLFCPICVPAPGPAVARCGTRAYAKGNPIQPPFPEKCPDCIEAAYHEFCRTCGAW